MVDALHVVVACPNATTKATMMTDMTDMTNSTSPQRAGVWRGGVLARAAARPSLEKQRDVGAGEVLHLLDEEGYPAQREASHPAPERSTGGTLQRGGGC